MDFDLTLGIDFFALFFGRAGFYSFFLASVFSLAFIPVPIVVCDKGIS